MKHSEQTKQKLSQIRKKWLTDNPDKHLWKRKDKFISKPCEIFKKKLEENGVFFLEEGNLVEGRAYAVDVIIPNKMIGFEINGNQHYNEDKTLKEYYEKRKKEIESLGWKLYDIHYSKVFDENFINGIVKFIESEKEIPNLEFNFFPNKRIKKFCKDCNKEISYNSKERCLKCHNVSRRTEKYEVNLKYKIGGNKKDKILKHCDCGEVIDKKSNNCKKCFDEKQRKVDRPNLEILLEEVKNIGYSAVGRKYGVSDNSIRKWIKNYQK